MTIDTSQMKSLFEVEQPSVSSKAQKVYLIQDEQTKLVKIGISNNPELRRATLEREYKTKLTILGTNDAPNASQIEAFLHHHLNQYRVYKEWFSLSDSTLRSVLRYFLQHVPVSKKTRGRRKEKRKYVPKPSDIILFPSFREHIFWYRPFVIFSLPKVRKGEKIPLLTLVPLMLVSQEIKLSKYRPRVKTGFGPPDLIEYCACDVVLTVDTSELRSPFRFLERGLSEQEFKPLKVAVDLWSSQNGKPPLISFYDESE